MFRSVLSTLLYFWWLVSCGIYCLDPLTAALNGSTTLPACQLDDLKYDFTECDSFGGRWRVSVPVAPNKCSFSPANTKDSGSFSAAPPLRVHQCYSACESGQYFNASSLLCVGCPAGHYSLGGGILIESFNQSADSGGGGGLPDGFNIRTESNLHTPEMDRLCSSGWHVDPATGQLVSSTAGEPSQDESPSTTTPLPASLTCISVLTYTVKVVKSGRLRFEYRYRLPGDLSTLLFSFHYRLYANGGVFEGDSSGGQFARRYPPPTVEQQSFEVNEVAFDRPGLYVFTWRSVFVDHPRGGGGRFEMGSQASGSSNQQGLFKDSLNNGGLFSLGFIRLRRLLVEGIAYASECTPCGPATYAASVRSRSCSACPPNTASEAIGATACRPCDPIAEYAPRGSLRCRRRPLCGRNDFYAIPLDGGCNATSGQQKVFYRWIEPRICLDSKGVFPGEGERLVNCTAGAADSSSTASSPCDLGMDLQEDSSAPTVTLEGSNASSFSAKQHFCQFCPEGSFRGDYSSPACTPCPPFTSPYYALSVFRWNSSLPSWSASASSSKASSLEDKREEYFTENPRYLNAYLSRLCIHTDEDDGGGGGDGGADATGSDDSKVEECDSRNTWQPFADHIRTGASSMLDSYLIFSLAVPGFRSAAGGELSFVFETFCDAGDSCALMFVETRADEGELAELVSRQLKQKVSQPIASDSTSTSTSSTSRQKYLFLHSSNHVLKEWYQSTEGGRLSYRHRIEMTGNGNGNGGGSGNGSSLIYSWVFKRTTSFQSYAKVYSLLLTNSLAGSAVQCKSCPLTTGVLDPAALSSSQCVTCPQGQYLEDGEDGEEDVKVDGPHAPVVRSSPPAQVGHLQCRHCPPNYVVNRSLALPIGRRTSCLACGPGLTTENSDEDADRSQPSSPVCFSNCSVTFADGDRYELAELTGSSSSSSSLEYRGGSMFTAGGTQFLHLFRISLCGHPARAKLSSCANNITDVYEESTGSSGSSAAGIRAFICRSTIIPDSPGVIYTTQSFSIGDELIAITRQPVYGNISVHSDFLQQSNGKKSKDFHLYFRTRSVTTGACPQGRRMTVTMRCSRPEVAGGMKKEASTVISTPKSCPAGTCDGCTFHLLIETATAAACRLCTPFSAEDFDTVVGECIDGQQQVHFINPRGCVVLEPGKPELSVLSRPCSVLLPRHIQIAISAVIALGLLLLLLVFHFWNQNRSLEYKYSKLIEHGGSGLGGKHGGDEDDDGDLAFDNCCAEMDGEEEEEEEQNGRGKALHHLVQLEQNNNNNSSSNNNRLDKSKTLLGSSTEMQTLFGGSPPQKLDNHHNHHNHPQQQLDEEGYETIHLTPASAAMSAAKSAASKRGGSPAAAPNQIV